MEVSLAALALALAARHRPRILGLVEFLSLCYSGSNLDAATSALGERLPATGALPQNFALGGWDFEHGWQSFANRAREWASSLPDSAPPAQRARGVGADLPPRRVVVRMTGGFGNQLFQYAAGLAYARKTGLPLRLDLTAYDSEEPHRDFLLGRLRVPIRRANSFEVVWARRRPFWENRGYFANYLLRDSGSAWLCGFWEDPAYFGEVVQAVKRGFVPRDPAVSAAAASLVRRARDSGGPVVGVHMRRGDRGPGGTAQAPFSTMPPEYYRLAAERFPPGTSFLVFSDTPGDIAWCRANLGIGDEFGVTFGDGRDPVLDMFALAGCDHVILSAGTFSWWAGYLGDRDGRRVIAPNPLQALSAEKVVLPPSSPPLATWEIITLPPQ